MTHVFGLPDPDRDGLEDVEAFCSERYEREFVFVLYHEKPQATARGWMCRGCGFYGWNEVVRLAS